MIADFDDRFILPEIPHNRLAAGVSRRQNVLNLPVPSECLDVFWRLLRQEVGRGKGTTCHPLDREPFALPLFPTSPQKAQESRWGFPNPNSVRVWELNFPERIR